MISANEALVELRERLERARENLVGLADDAGRHSNNWPQANRLAAKAEGVQLAISYLDDIQLLVDIQPGTA